MADSVLIEELLRQYASNPRRVFARLANEYRKQGDLTTAIEICRSQVPLQPTYISGYIVLGQALFESGQHDEARATFEAAIALDPENLIALRQLGDIARLSGDIEGARAWYYRLLEVDPQNDDVATHVRALEKVPATPAQVPRMGEPVSWSDINPERAGATPAAVIPPLPRVTLGVIPEDITAALSAPTPAPATPPAAEGSAPGAGVSSRTPTVEFAGLEEFAKFQKPIAPPPAVPARAPTAAGTAEVLPDISFFAREASAEVAMPTPMATPAVTPAVAPPAAPPAAPAAVPPVTRHAPEGTEEEPALDVPVTRHPPPSPTPPNLTALRETLAFRTPAASAAIPPRAPTPAATPLTPAPAPLAPPLPAPPAPVAPPAARSDPRHAIDLFGSHGAPGGVPPSSPHPAPRPSFAESQEADYDPTVGRMLDLTGGPGTAVPDGFMTETMAELYLQQGYHDEALKIYRYLAALRPDDNSLRDRITRLELGARSSVPLAAQVSEDVISAAHGRASRPPQSIKNFFGGLAARRAPGSAPGASSGSASASSMPSTPAVPAAASHPPRPQSLTGESEAAINEMFGGDAATSDEAAATSLAGAFAEEYTNGETPPTGNPARAASEPLSLDDVFRGNKPAPEPKRPAENVSFDEFFTARDSGGAPSVASPAPQRAGDGGGAPPEMDLALFHDWLDGLKK